MTALPRLSALVRAGGRVLLWALVVLLLARGAIDVVSPSASDVDTQSHGQSSPAPNVAEQEIAALATSFARAYLTFSPARLDQRAAALEPYLSPWLGVQGGLELPPDAAQQSVLAAQPARVLWLNRSEALVTVAVELLPPRPEPLYLTVPVAAAPGGTMAVVGYPSFASPPGRTPLSEPQPTALEPGVRVQVEDLLRHFFPVYLAGDAGELAYFLPPGGRVDALGGDYRFLELVRVDAASAAEATRLPVLARIRVLDQAARATYLLQYRLQLERRDRWYVAAINTA